MVQQLQDGSSTTENLNVTWQEKKNKPSYEVVHQLKRETLPTVLVI